MLRYLPETSLPWYGILPVPPSTYPSYCSSLHGYFDSQPLLIPIFLSIGRCSYFILLGRLWNWHSCRVLLSEPSCPLLAPKPRERGSNPEFQTQHLGTLPSVLRQGRDETVRHRQKWMLPPNRLDASQPAKLCPVLPVPWPHLLSFCLSDVCLPFLVPNLSLKLDRFSFSGFDLQDHKYKERHSSTSVGS